MEYATEKQVIALKRFAKNSELSNGVLKGVQFDELSKDEASELISKCHEHQNRSDEEDSDFRIRFSQNFRNGNGAFKTVTLNDGELVTVREAHSKHCQQVIMELEEDYPDDRELQIAMFDKQCDKIFTWIQQTLDEKVRKTRGQNGS